MAKENLKEQEKLQQEKVAESISKVDAFFNENKKTITSILCCLVVLGLGILAYQHFVRAPKIAEALAQSYQAQAAFDKGEFELALKGDGNTLGFEQVIEDYGSAAGESVYLYAGLCELQLGNYENAINFLDKYDGDDTILAARAIAAKADAYSALENYDKAIALYNDAAKKADNAYAAEYLLKAAVVCEETGNTAKALETYKLIKDKYPMTREGQTIDKYISRIENAPAK